MCFQYDSGSNTPSVAPTAAPTPEPTPSPIPSSEPVPAPSSGPKVSSMAWEHFGLLNDLRATGFRCPYGTSFGANSVPLKLDCRLWKAAKLHSQDMADQNYFNHNSMDGRSPWDRASAQGISANGENIAAGNSDAQGVLDAWKNSDGHCRNMGNPGFKLFAIGYGYNSGSSYKHYWTQMFKADEVPLDTSCYPDGGLLEADVAMRRPTDVIEFVPADIQSIDHSATPPSSNVIVGDGPWVSSEDE